MKAVYAGSFDPITLGHLSVIRQARICNWEDIVILVATNPEKEYMFSKEERIALVEHCVSGMNGVFVPTRVCVDSWDGLVIDYAKKKGVDVLIRGIRDETDAVFEMNLAQVNKALAEVPTIFFPSDSALSQVSSSKLKDLVKEGKDASMFCLPHVYNAIKKRMDKAT